MPVIVPDPSLDLYHQAVEAAGRGEWDEAEADFRAALEGLPETPASYDTRRRIYHGLASVYQHLQRAADAEAVRREELGLVKHVHGARHPHVATCLEHQACLAWRQARTEAAEALFRQARALRESLQGRGHPAVSDSLTGLAAVRRVQGAHEEADGLLQAAATLLEEALPWCPDLEGTVEESLLRLQRYLEQAWHAPQWVDARWQQRLETLAKVDDPQARKKAEQLEAALCTPPLPGAWDDALVEPPEWDGEEAFDFIELAIDGPGALEQLVWSGLRVYRLLLITGPQLSPQVEHLLDLRELSLQGGELEELPPALFRLPHLRRLDVLGHRLAQVPPELGDLRTLRHLDLSHNRLTALPDSVGSLHELEVLRVQHNRLESLPETLGQLSNLRELAASHNPLGTLPLSLGYCMSLSVLEVSDARLEHVPPTIEALAELRALDISHNGLERLPASMGNMGTLESLDLAGNRLTELPDSIASLTMLRTLKLSGNPLDALPASLCTLPQLEGLHVSHTRLTELPERLGQLPRLSVLEADHAQLESLPDGLGQLQRLRRLSLASNRLTEIPRSLGDLDGLQTLDLSGNRLSRLPEALTRLSALTALALDQNNLTELPRTVDHWSALERLTLDHNQLEELPGALTRLPRLAYLSVAANKLRRLPPAVGGLPNLQVLRIFRNELKTIPLSWAALPALEELMASFNRLSTLPPLQGPMTRLNLGHNRLSDLPPGLALPDLQHLTLRHNRLDHFPEAVLHCPALQKLDLSQNSLESLPEGLDELTALTEIDLSGNRFLTVPPVLARMDLQDIRMEGNPLRKADAVDLQAHLEALLARLREAPHDAPALIEAAAAAVGGPWAHFLRTRAQSIIIGGSLALLQQALSEPPGTPIAEAAETVALQNLPEALWLRPLTHRAEGLESWRRTIALPARREGVHVQGNDLIVLLSDRLMIYRMDTAVLARSLTVPPFPVRRKVGPNRDVPVLMARADDCLLIHDSHQSLIWANLRSGEVRRLMEVREVRRITLLAGGEQAILEFDPHSPHRVPVGREKACVFDLQTGLVAWELPCEGGVSPIPLPDGERVVAVSSGRVKIHRLQDGKVLDSFGKGVTAIALLDNTTLATGNDQGRVDLWGMPGCRWLRHFGETDETTGPVVALGTGTAGEWLACVSDGKLKLWHVPDGLLAFEAPVATEDVHEVRIAPGGRFVLVSNWSGHLEIFGTVRAAQLQHFHLPVVTDTVSAAVADGMRLYPMTVEQLTTVPSEALAALLERASDGLHRETLLAITPQHVFSLSDKGELRRMAREDGEPQQALSTEVAQPQHFACSDDGHRLVVANRFDCVLWDLRQDTSPLGRIEVGLTISDVVLSGEEVLVATRGGTLRIYDFATQALRSSVDLPDASAAIVDASHRLLLGIEKTQLVVWDFQGKVLRAAALPETRTWLHMTVDDSGRWLAAWHPHREALHVLNLDTGRVRDYTSEGATVEGACWYGEYLLWGDSAGVLHVLDPARREEATRWTFDSPLVGVAAAHERVAVALEGGAVSLLAWTPPGTPRPPQARAEAALPRTVEIDTFELPRPKLRLADMVAGVGVAPSTDSQVPDLLLKVAWAASDSQLDLTAPAVITDSQMLLAVPASVLEAESIDTVEPAAAVEADAAPPPELPAEEVVESLVEPAEALADPEPVTESPAVDDAPSIELPDVGPIVLDETDLQFLIEMAAQVEVPVEGLVPVPAFEEPVGPPAEALPADLPLEEVVLEAVALEEASLEAVPGPEPVAEAVVPAEAPPVVAPPEPPPVAGPEGPVEAPPRRRRRTDNLPRRPRSKVVKLSTGHLPLAPEPVAEQEKKAEPPPARWWRRPSDPTTGQ